MNSEQDTSAQLISTRWPEVAVAVLLQLIAVLVIVDSRRVGIDWADDGPKAGYFPFYVGLLLFAAATWVLINALRSWKQTEHFAERGQIALVIAMFIPMVLYVFAIQFLGIYLASIGLIAYFMLRHGKYSLPLTAAVSLGVPLLLFLVFERWFLVPLPKGPIEQWLGF
jgi:hypothetical protein